jgi:hypothetical protein
MEYRTIGMIIAILLVSSSMANGKRIVWDEVISHERLRTRIDAFNSWFTKFSGREQKVEARLTTDPNWTRIGLFAKENIKIDDVWFLGDRSKMITAELVYKTKVGEIIKGLEETYGYDDYTNMVFYLLHEMNNKDSEWKPYLDLLPHQPTSIAFKYWDKKAWIEDELIHTPILSKHSSFKFTKIIYNFF